MTKWLTGSKSPGLIILEHELSDQSLVLPSEDTETAQD